MTELSNLKLWQKVVFGVILSVFILIVIGLMFGLIIFFFTLNLEDTGFMEVGLSIGLFVGVMFAIVGGASGISKLLSRWWKIKIDFK